MNPRPTILVEVDYDRTFAADVRSGKYGTGYTPASTANYWFSTVNAVYSQYVGVTFQVRKVQVNDNVTADTASGAVKQLRDDHPPEPPTDLVTFWRGSDHDASEIGSAFEPGFHSTIQTVPHMYWGAPRDVGAVVYLLKHELGHNLNGRHEEHDWWYENSDYRRTIMRSQLDGLFMDWFSFGNRDPTHDNEERIRKYAQCRDWSP